MFTSTELYKRQDMSKVQRCLEALSKVAARFGCTVPPIDSTQKAPPKKVALVAEADSERPSEQALQTKLEQAKVPRNAHAHRRATHTPRQASCKALEEEETSLRAQIRDLKQSWRTERTQLVYAVSNAEKGTLRRESAPSVAALQEEQAARDKAEASDALARAQEATVTAMDLFRFVLVSLVAPRRRSRTSWRVCWSRNAPSSSRWSTWNAVPLLPSILSLSRSPSRSHWRPQRTSSLSS